jgi:hypothetical protein
MHAWVGGVLRRLTGGRQGTEMYGCSHSHQMHPPTCAGEGVEKGDCIGVDAELGILGGNLKPNSQ